MTRFVIGSDVALDLAASRAVVAPGHQLLAPALLRSQVLSALYGAVRRNAIDRKEAEHQLDHLRKLRIRLLGDRVLQQEAWKTAAEFGWPDTFDAEYVALTRLQGDALVTLDRRLARAIAGKVPLAPRDALGFAGQPAPSRQGARRRNSAD